MSNGIRYNQSTLFARYARSLGMRATCATLSGFFLSFRNPGVPSKAAVDINISIRDMNTPICGSHARQHVCPFCLGLDVGARIKFLCLVKCLTPPP